MNHAPTPSISAEAPETGQVPVYLRDESERKAFEAMLVNHMDGLVMHAQTRTISKHDAEDLVQDTLLRSWESRTFEPTRPNPLPWLTVIINNAAINLHRNNSQGIRRLTVCSLSDYEDEPVSVNTDPEHVVNAIAGTEEFEIALEALRKLAEDGKIEMAQLILLDALGFKPIEIAEIFDISHGNARVRAGRARHAAKAAITQLQGAA